MRYSDVCDFIFKLYLYGVSAKMIHYSTDSNHGHELSDSLWKDISDNTDTLAEEYFGFYGKPRYEDLSIKQDISTEKDLNKICQKVIDILDAMRKEFDKNDKLSGLVSHIDDFKGEMSKYAFLGTFDKVSNYTLNK